MLNEERIILMTRMAAYEQGEGRKNVKIGNYFRSDYIAVQVLKAVICSTLAYGLGFGVWMLCNVETFLETMYELELLLAFIRNVLTKWGIFTGSYTALVYVVGTWRHARAKKSLKCYYHNLKKLNSLYNET